LVSIPAVEEPINTGEDIYRHSVHKMVGCWVCRLPVVVNTLKNGKSANLKTVPMLYFFLTMNRYPIMFVKQCMSICYEVLESEEETATYMTKYFPQN
jgi:hypothetical protein